MKIVFEHSGVLPVSKYGGTERIIFWLMKELAQMGHEVFLIGHPQSQVATINVKLISSLLLKKNKSNLADFIPADTDILHLFYAPQNLPLKWQKKLLVTIEGNGKKGEQFPLNTVFVSKKHASNHGSHCYVYNGLDLSEYPFLKKDLSWKNFIFLAKSRWKVKNLESCVLACRYSKKHLYIAGGRAWSFSRYIHSYGMVEIKKKLELLKKCDALLFPVRWHEPFGIAIIEAMALGLPVIGGPYGSLPEIVLGGEGKSVSPYGMIVSDFNHLKEILKNPPNIKFKSEEIRSYVEKKFSSALMAKNYLSLYQKILNEETLNTTFPSWNLDLGPEELLLF